MKKRKLIFSILIMIFIFSTIKLITALASENSIIVTGMEIIDKSNEVVVNSCSFDETSINLDVDFHNLNNYLTYKIILKNNDTLDYKIKSITDNSESKYLDYQFEFTEDKFEAKGNKEIVVTIKYEKEIEEIVERINNENISIELVLEDENGNKKEENINVTPGNNTSGNTNRTIDNTNTTNHKTNNTTNKESIIVAESNNPKTGDNIKVYFIIELLALILLVTFVRKNKELQKTKRSKKGKHSKGTKLFGLIVFGLLVLPSVAKAGTNTIVITSKTSLNLYDKLVVSYNVNGEVKKEIIKYNTKLGELDAVNLDGYEFKGWYTEPNGGEKITGETVITEDITFYAQFDIINYDITYNLNGGELTNPNPTSYTVEDEIVLNNPQKQGYTFSGWTGSNGDNLQTQVTINKGTTGNKEYVANYSANTNTQYKVIHKKMDINGENYIESDVDYLEGATDTTVTPEVKDYKGFTPPTEQNLVITGDGKAELIYEYTRNKYNLKYENTDYIDLAQSTPTGDYYYGKTITAVAKDKEGYYFTGWSNGKITKEISFEIEDDITLKPNYKANNYQVIFDANGGTGEMENQTLTYDEASKLNASTFTKQGYTFKNWNTKEDGQGITYADEANVTNLAKEGSITLYAQYTPNTNTIYTVVHEQMNLDGTTYTVKETERLPGTTDTTVTPDVKSYYGFTSPTAQSLVITGDGNASITYQYTRQKFDLEIQDEEFVDTQTPSDKYYYETEIKLTAKTRTGYTFKQWSTGETTNQITFVLGENTTVKPIYKPNEFVVTYNANSGYFVTEGVTTNEVSYYSSNKNVKSGTYKVPLEATHGFDGWYTTTTCDVGTEFDVTTYEDCEDITVYAKWKLYRAKFNMRALYRTFHDGAINGTRIKFAVTAIKQATELPDWAVGKDWSKNLIKNDEYQWLYGTKADTSTIYQLPILFWCDNTEKIIYWYSLDNYPVVEYTNTYGTQIGFCDFNELTDISGISNWDVSGLDQMEGFFSNCKKLTDLTPIRNWNVSNVTNMKKAFAGMLALTDASPLNNWTVNKDADFTQMFKNTTARPTFTFNIGGIEKAGTWDSNGTLIVPTE